MKGSKAGLRRSYLLGACGLLLLGACSGVESSESVGSSSQALDSGIDGGATLVLLNEVKINPPGGGDPTFEYIELKGTPSGLLTNLYVLQIDGDGATVGQAVYVANLSTACGGSSCAFGTNGFFVVKTAAGGHATGSTPTQVVAGELQNASYSILLVYSTAAITQGTDYDTNNDGQLDLPAGAFVVDAVGWRDAT